MLFFKGQGGGRQKSGRPRGSAGADCFTQGRAPTAAVRPGISNGMRKTETMENNRTIHTDGNGAESRERVIAVGVNAAVRDEALASTDETLDELEALVETAGGEVVLRAIQNRQSPEPATLIGEGKCAEIAEAVRSFDAALVVFDNDLSPVQMKNLEEKLDCPVMDRTGVILDIFASRASTAEGKLQVALAQYRYLLPRLAGQGRNLSRQTSSGGKSPIGTRGPGETKLETDRRHIRARITRLEAELEAVRKVRGEQRRRREKSEIPLVALVGYTNAGKSTLLNALAAPEGGAAVHTADRLFDTLDPTTRSVTLPDRSEILLTDTVGFIRSLPHQLVSAFRATLEELSYADLVLHVIDASNPQREEQIRVTEQLADELCAEGVPRIAVYNKCDLCDADALVAESENTVCISAATGRNLGRLVEMIQAAVSKRRVDFDIKLPYARAGVLEQLYDSARVDSAEYLDDGIAVKGSCDSRLYGQIRKLLGLPE